MSLTVGLMGTSSCNLGDYSIEVFLDKNQWIRVVDSKKYAYFLNPNLNISIKSLTLQDLLF